MSKITHKFVAFNFECTPSFATWWEAKWSKKYGGDIREDNDHPFKQLFFKTYPKNDELENWKEMVNQKNQLLLIGIFHCPSFLTYDAHLIFHSLTLILVFLILQPNATLKKWMSGQKRKLRKPWFFKRLGPRL